MHLITRKALIDFWKIHRDAEVPLRSWAKAITRRPFANLTELKAVFGSVDYVPVRHGLHVFNIGGNKYRLITAIHFNRQKIYVRNVLTHADYSKGEWIK